MQKSNIYEFPLVGLSLGCLSEMDTALESTNRKLLQGKIEKTLFFKKKNSESRYFRGLPSHLYLSSSKFHEITLEASGESNFPQ